MVKEPVHTFFVIDASKDDDWEEYRKYKDKLPKFTLIANKNLCVVDKKHITDFFLALKSLCMHNCLLNQATNLQAVPSTIIRHLNGCVANESILST